VSEPTAFAEFVRRIRAGDEQAAADLVRRFEPLVRREVRLRLEDRRLARAFDSMDVCQSVMASFFVRVAAGQYDLENPGQLIGLLVKMARNKLASSARDQTRQRRDHRRAAGGDAGLDAVAGGDPTPSQVVSNRELLDAMRAKLTDDERAVADLRAQGLEWAEVAQRLGGTAPGRRMQLGRAVDRVARELGLDEAADE
jgi:RNA polymerase sigma-70 factor (ECF subfamily)